MYSAVRDIEGLSRTHLPMQEKEYRPIEERQKILALMEGRMLAQVLSFMEPRRRLTMCAVSPTARVCAELVQVSDTCAPYKMCLGDRLVHRFLAKLTCDDDEERLRHLTWWLVKCGLPLHLNHSSTFTALRAVAPTLLPMVRSSPLSAYGVPCELQVSDILQLEEMCIYGDHVIPIASLTPSQLTRLRRLTVDKYTSKVCEEFLLQLPGLTELFIDDADWTPVSLMEPAYAARLLRLTICNPAMNTLSWIYECTSVTHLSITRCGSVLDLRLLIDLPYLTSLDMTGSNVPHLDGLSRCRSLTRIVFTLCSQLLSLEGLAGAPRLRSIDASSSLVQTLGELHRCPSLTNIVVRGCPELLSLEGLAGAPQLRSIDASYSGVVTLGELHRCPSLTTVDFRSCRRLRSIEGLAGAPQLKDVNLNGTAVMDITPLTASASSLRTLDLQNRSVTNIAAIAGATQLEEVYLTGTAVTDITPLTGSASSLRRLFLEIAA
ncbi:hypothetical protein NESM_000915300 [Novymonas esmeraldas]|uniref:Uncharacterized protein n=1 Tax=Novymonas esmeraldas TaxID=1808958 RepID=A0AAW0F1G9_9TRYP